MVVGLLLFDIKIAYSIKLHQQKQLVVLLVSIGGKTIHTFTSSGTFNNTSGTS